MYLLPGLGITLDDLAGAITRQEGACSSPGVCRGNNPGNLRAGPGSVGVDSRGIAIFPDYATGYSALIHQEQLNVDRGLTTSEFFGGKPGVYAGYAPASDSNNPAGYTANVAGWLGIDPNVPLSSVLSGDSVGSSPSLPAPPVDTPVSGSVFDFGGGGDGTSAGLSGGAMVALGLAAFGLLWVALD